LAIFPEEIELREEVAARYQALLPAGIKRPSIKPHNRSVYAQYTIEVSDRDRLQKALQEKGIPTAAHYPLGLHEQPIIKDLFPNMPRFSNTEHAAQHVMSLPMHPYLTLAEQKNICSALQLCSLGHFSGV
jgi:UDP-2-acetamido-2-deoxy-ribo-hexuluronate aminotransferase